MGFVDLHVHSDASDGTFTLPRLWNWQKMPVWMPLH